jgi:dUTP pyrophosphatase
MFNKIKDIKNSLDMIKSLQSGFENNGSVNYEEILSSMGVDMEDVEKSFGENFKTTVDLHYRLDSDNKEPEYAYKTDSGFDLRANEMVTLGPLERALVGTGLYLDVPKNCEVQVRPKSGLSIKKGLSVVNTPGTVDFGYTGEIKVILINLSNETHTINIGDKIAQAVVCPVLQGKDVVLKRVSEIQEKDRNDNGFGSTGN